VTALASLDWRLVQAEQTLPELVIEINRTTLARAVLGTRDLYPIHHDHEFAQANGARDIFLNTMWYQGVLGRYATDWAGPESFVRALAVEMRSPNCPGDTLTVRGEVARRHLADGRPLVDLDISIGNQLQQRAVVGAVTVELAPVPCT
jgi:acyl dehydratase